MRQLWYAVQVLCGREGRACDLISRTVDPALLLEAFVPRYETQRKVRGEWRTSSDVLFPGYLVVALRSRAALGPLRDELRSVPEFARVLTAGEAYVPLSDSERGWISALARREDRTVGMSFGVMEGDRVVVTSGPLVGHEGWIRSVNRRKGLACLEVRMFGRTMQTKVGLGIVAKRPAAE